MIKLKSGVHASDFKVRGRGSRSARQKGLTFQRVFSTKGKAPLDEVEWESRTAEITDDSGKVIFKQEGGRGSEELEPARDQDCGLEIFLWRHRQRDGPV